MSGDGHGFSARPYGSRKPTTASGITVKPGGKLISFRSALIVIPESLPPMWDEKRYRTRLIGRLLPIYIGTSDPRYILSKGDGDIWSS